MIDNERLIETRDNIYNFHKIQMGIGTLSEKTIHAVLKNYYEPNIDYHEVVIGKFVADIYKDEYGRRRSEEEHHDAGGSLPVPHRSDHRLPRFLRLSDLRYR